MRRLHFAGGCWRVPGEDYFDYIDCGQEFPIHELIHARCKDCFPDEKNIKDDDQELEQDGSATSSSSGSASDSQ